MTCLIEVGEEDVVVHPDTKHRVSDGYENRPLKIYPNVPWQNRHGAEDTRAP